MTWTQVKTAIDLWNPSKSWGGSNEGISSFTGDEDTGEVHDIYSYLESFYVSDTFAAILDDMVSSGIRLAKANGPSHTKIDFSYSAWNPSQEVVYFNSQGTLVSGINPFIIVHELLHQYLHEGDFDPDHRSITDQNGESYDFLGPIVTVENQIIAELSATDSQYTDHQYSGYFMQFKPSDASSIYGFSLDTNYTDLRLIDISRRGDEEDNVLDMRNRTDNSRDLIFGDEGNDTIYGGSGDDNLYGGGDPSHAGSGKDKLYGGDGGDRLYGGDDNDFLDSGLNIVDEEVDLYGDKLDGGAGDDVLILRGIWIEEAIGGTGDDVFWVDSDPNGSYWIADSDSGDTLYWNGYQLLGGTKQVIEFVWDDPNSFDAYWDVGAVDSHGIRYYWIGSELSISLPDGSGIMVQDFTDGDFGIHVGGAIQTSDFIFQWNNSTQQIEYVTSLPLSSITLDSFESNYQDLSGYSYALANDGPNAIPTTYIP